MTEDETKIGDGSNVMFKDVPQKVLAYVKSNAIRNDASSVLSAIESYASEREKTIAIGSEKRTIVENLLKEHNPTNVLELGTFFGYSALTMARFLTKPNSMVFTVEVFPAFAKTAQELIEFAGMQRRIQVFTGDSLDILNRFAVNHTNVFDFVLLDHDKSAYKRDLIKLEELKLIRKGSVILADNVIYPGCPGYLEYVRNDPKYECINFPAKDAYTDIGDAMEKSVFIPL